MLGCDGGCDPVIMGALLSELPRCHGLLWPASFHKLPQTRTRTRVVCDSTRLELVHSFPHTR